MKAKLLIDFFGSLWPYIFPDQEFKPKRLVAVIIVVTLLVFGIDYFGTDTVEQAIDLGGDIMDKAEE